MGRRSEMESLVGGIQASRTARDRATVMFLTLSGQWSVRDGFERLGMRRTRFQDLRRKMLEAAVCALEEGIGGRPRREVIGESRRIGKLRCQVEELGHELRLVRAQLDLAEHGLSDAIAERKAQLLARSAPGRN